MGIWTKALAAMARRIVEPRRCWRGRPTRPVALGGGGETTSPSLPGGWPVADLPPASAADTLPPLPSPPSYYVDLARSTATTTASTTTRPNSASLPVRMCITNVIIIVVIISSYIVVAANPLILFTCMPVSLLCRVVFVGRKKKRRSS